MSLLLKTISAFPRGRTTQELLVLVGAGFLHEKRVAALAELSELLETGQVERGRDGRWKPKSAVGAISAGHAKGGSDWSNGLSPDTLFAVAARFHTMTRSPEPEHEADDNSGAVDPGALLRYWRSALRADPRGATTQAPDKHGFEWALISGRGPMVPGEDENLTVTIELDALQPSFREALVRREGNENALAIGWPMAVGRRGGVPIFQPVGLLAATWERTSTDLVLTVEADDVLVNPDWIRTAARGGGWNRDALAELFDAADGVGLRADDFIGRMRDAVARQVRGAIRGVDLAAQLEVHSHGVFDSAAMFLPSESSFTAGAVRDLDRLATWPTERLARTALAPVFQIEPDGPHTPQPEINVGPLNGEQLRAVQLACAAPLTVVTGPPGTGKSQAIVSMAASVLLSGGSVLVASKNHQALDAVEARLGALAPDTPFVVRTLKPEDEINIGFADVLKQLIDHDQTPCPASPDDLMHEDIEALAIDRARALELEASRARLECDIAETLERIAFRETRTPDRDDTPAPTPTAALHRTSWLARLQALFSRLLRRTPPEAATGAGGPLDAGASLPALRDALARLRAERDTLATPGDPILLGEQIQDLCKSLLPKHMGARAHVSNERRQQIAEAHSDWEFASGRGPLPGDLALDVVAHRPLWLASILGTPRRIPLDDGLFDLVVFDEASQCDIATAIPLFARARRAVVIGDDKQLSFIPQLGRAQDRNLMQAQGLPIARMGRYAQSRRSLFDFAARMPGAERIALRRQYRSAGPIVEYINEAFYGGELLASCDLNGLVVPEGARPGLAWEHVPAPAVPTNGNVNPAEVTAIVAHLRKLLTEQGYSGSIGIITPFRAQVQALHEALNAALSPAAQQTAELKIATVDSFQGQERDLILFSPCVGPRSPTSGLNFFQRDTRRLNVAISRARAVAMIFGDLDFARSGKSQALRRLAAMATEPPPCGGEGVFDSTWEERVFYALKARSLDPVPQYEIAGRRLDFALFGQGDIKLDLEVDGRRWHQTIDGRRKTSDLWRDHQLKSLGWRVRRFWVDELAQDMEKCLDRIERDLF